jgi:hypothetical protein
LALDFLCYLALSGIGRRWLKVVLHGMAKDDRGNHNDRSQAAAYDFDTLLAYERVQYSREFIIGLNATNGN